MGKAAETVDARQESGVVGISHRKMKQGDKQSAEASDAKNYPFLLMSREKESMNEFIEKKREMFLLNLNLKNKKDEIEKLEEKAAAREAELKESEEKLEEEAAKFDAFLKENDRKTHEALKKAEHETKLKNEKVQELRKLNEQLYQVENELSKQREALDECVRCKEFLDSLTPPEWLEKNRKLSGSLHQSVNVSHIVSMKEVDKSEISTLNGTTSGRQRRKSVIGNTDRKEKPKLKVERPSSIKEESDEAIPMYFKEPSQLLDIFQALEEENLFLIQNSQDSENALEALNEEYKKVQDKMTDETSQLRKNIDSLVESIQFEKNRATELKTRMHTSAGEAFTPARQEALLRQLNKKVSEVYEQCGFDASTNPSTLTMLGELEAKLEDLLAALSRMPPEYVMKAEKEKEKKRREKKRAEQQALQLQQQEERNRKAVERAMQQPKSQRGRKVVESIRPSRRVTKVVATEFSERELDEIKYLS